MVDLVQRIINTGVVAIVRTDSAKKAIEICMACKEGGIDAVEITFSVPHAADVIKQIDAEVGNEILLGAGTVLDGVTAKTAIEAGAKYIVAPNVSEDTAFVCNRYGIPYIPGALTPTEIVRALEIGAALVKLFPASTVGPSYIKAIHGPLPQANLIPTGGVNLDNAAEWIKAGAVAIGVGGALTKGNVDQIAKKASELLRIVRKARK